MNSLYLNAANNQETQRPPIWLMRQAGRYMPEYRAIRSKHSFMSMIHNPTLAAEITLQPIQAFGMDAAILFSDILTTAEALGGHLEFHEGRGPLFKNPIRTAADLSQLNAQTGKKKLSYVYEAAALTKQKLTDFGVPLIGFCGAPFTIAAYLVEGQSSPDLKTLKKLMFTEPEVVHHLLDLITDITIDYANGQLAAGVDAFQIFDTWALHLSWDDFKTFSLPYIQKIIAGLKNPGAAPVTVFARGSSGLAPLLATSGANVLSLDWQSNLPEIKKAYPHLAVQGNLDPHILYGSKAMIEQKVGLLLAAMKPYKGFIFNLGHGIMPDMDPETIRFLVKLVQSHGA
ncbi:MAG: uroporphyrinogen decarboxylase [Candidatus Margulisiibacteriota bacterium]